MTENNKSTKNSISHRITAISTIFIACVAVGISIWQGYETRRHNRLSAKPFLGIRFSISEKKPLMGVWIENNGFGPAIIKEFIVYLDGQPTKVNSYEAAKKVYQAAKIYDKSKSFWSPMKSAVLKLGGRINIISYPKENWTTEGIEKFKERLSHLGFKFIYESIYEEEFKVSVLVE